MDDFKAYNPKHKILSLLQRHFFSRQTFFSSVYDQDSKPSVLAYLTYFPEHLLNDSCTGL